MNVYEFLNDHADDTIELHLSWMHLENIPKLNRFNRLRSLIISNNNIYIINYLPEQLEYFDCASNHLTCLPSLPEDLETLICNYNQLTSLPELPECLEKLICHHNQLTELPELNDSLQLLDVDHNLLTTLPDFPSQLKKLYCQYNQLTELPDHYYTIEIMHCNNNQLIELPYISKMNELYCDNNKIRYVPYINARYLYCLSMKNNPLDDMLMPYYNTSDELVCLLDKLYKFKTFYYDEKLKVLIMNYIWKNIRQPKIQEQYSPANLEKLLKENEEEDLLNVLDSW
jgi:hypothetical protein